MTQGKKIPRIQSISKVDGFRVYCVFNTGESGSINFERLFAEWGVNPGDAEGVLLDLNEFQKIKLRDGVLSWENVEVPLIKEDNTEGKFPYEIDPIVLYNQAEMLSNEKAKTSVLELKGDILTTVGLLEDEEQLKRILFFLTQDLQVEENEEGNRYVVLQKRPPYLQEEASADENLISDQEAWRGSKGLTF